MAMISGGAKLEAVIAGILKGVGSKPVVVEVGFLAGATYPDGTGVPAVAAYNEYGTERIPPRPFFRNMVHDKSPEWPQALAAVLKSTNYDAPRAMALMGEGIKGQLQKAIKDFNGVPLAPSTIARKGFDKQLIDTSHMLNSVDYEVKK